MRLIVSDAPGDEIITLYHAPGLSNGNTPTPSDFYVPNGGSVLLSGSVTLKARGFKPGFTDSEVAGASYSINTPPVVDAGPQPILDTLSTALEGFVSDDGLTGGGAQFTNWSKVSGPGTVSFGNASQTNSSVAGGSGEQ